MTLKDHQLCTLFQNTCHGAVVLLLVVSHSDAAYQTSVNVDCRCCKDADAVHCFHRWNWHGRSKENQLADTSVCKPDYQPAAVRDGWVSPCVSHTPHISVLIVHYIVLWSVASAYEAIQACRLLELELPVVCSLRLASRSVFSSEKWTVRCYHSCQWFLSTFALQNIVKFLWLHTHNTLLLLFCWTRAAY